MYLRLKVLAQNLQLYGLSPESVSRISPDRDIGYSGYDCSQDSVQAHDTHVAAGVARDVPFSGTSSHTDCRSIGFEPPS